MDFSSFAGSGGSSEVHFSWFAGPGGSLEVHFSSSAGTGESCKVHFLLPAGPGGSRKVLSRSSGVCRGEGRAPRPPEKDPESAPKEDGAREIVGGEIAGVGRGARKIRLYMSGLTFKAFCDDSKTAD